MQSTGWQRAQSEPRPQVARLGFLPAEDIATGRMIGLESSGCRLDLCSRRTSPPLRGWYVGLWQWAYRGIVADSLLDGLSESIFVERWRRVVEQADPERRLWVVEERSDLQGVCSTGLSRDDDAALRVAEVYAINIDPAFIGTGTGRQLFAWAVDDLRQRGFSEATLWVLRGNSRARRFYEIAGWEPVASAMVNPDFFPGYELDEVRYRAHLWRSLLFLTSVPESRKDQSKP